MTLSLTLFDIYPDPHKAYWLSVDACWLLIKGMQDTGQASETFWLAEILEDAAKSGEIEYLPYSPEDAAFCARQGHYPPMQLKASSVMEWAFRNQDIVKACEETSFWYTSLARNAGSSPDNTTEPFSFKMQREKDGYSPAIKEVAEAMYKELGRNANQHQAWNRLHSNPPPGYGIVSRKDHIEMPDELPLSRADFSKRWRKANK